MGVLPHYCVLPRSTLHAIRQVTISIFLMFGLVRVPVGLIKHCIYIVLNLKGIHDADAPKSRSYKKYVIIAVSGLLAVAIILTAILVGMHLFTEAQKDIVRVSDICKYYRLLKKISESSGA